MRCYTEFLFHTLLMKAYCVLVGCRRDWKMLLPSQQKASRSGCVRRKYLQQVTKTAVRPCEGRGGKHILIWSTRNSNVLAIKRKTNLASRCFGIKKGRGPGILPSWLLGFGELAHALKPLALMLKSHALFSPSQTLLHFTPQASGRRCTNNVFGEGIGLLLAGSRLTLSLPH